MLQSPSLIPRGALLAWPDYWTVRAPEPLADRRFVDVLLATFNRCPFPKVHDNPLSWTLDSLLEQYNARLGRIVVVDDGSTDYTHEVLRRYQSRFGGRVHVIADGQRRGSSGARNLGLRHCTSELIFVCDDDCHLTPHALYGLHQSYALQEQRDSACAAVHLAFYQRAIRPSKLVASKQIGFVDAHRGIYQTQLKCFPREYVERPRWLDCTAMLLAPLGIRHLCGVFLADRQAILACGGFPEEFRWPNAFCEELELSFRLTEMGRTLYHQPDTKFFAVHYKVGWNDPQGLRTVSEDHELRAFGTVGRVNPRILIADEPRLNSGNRVDLDAWCYSKLISYFVCFGRRSRRGAYCWMNRNLRAFVRDNTAEFYGDSGIKISCLARRAHLWQTAFCDGLRILSESSRRPLPHVAPISPLTAPQQVGPLGNRNDLVERPARIL